MALAELRNLSATSYFQSAVSVLTGNVAFTAAVLLRELGPTSTTQFICGNVSASRGWSFVRTSDTNSGATHNYTFTVFESLAAQTVSLAIPGSVGKMMLFHLVYTGTAVSVYVNGILLSTAATAGTGFSSSTGRFSIGYDVNAGAMPATDMSFVAFGLANVVYDDSAVAENTLATIKQQEITSAGLPTALRNIYSVSRDSGSGVPSTLRNFGSLTPQQTLEVVGRTDLSLSAPPSFLGDSVLASGGGGGGNVSGPGASTDNAVARWDGITGTLVQNSVVTIGDTGNIATPGTVDGRDISVDGAKLDTIATGATNTPAYDLIYDSGAVPSGNLYADFALLVAAGNALPGQKRAHLVTDLTIATAISLSGDWHLLGCADAVSAARLITLDTGGALNITDEMLKFENVTLFALDGSVVAGGLSFVRFDDCTVTGTIGVASALVIDVAANAQLEVVSSTLNEASLEHNGASLILRTSGNSELSNPNAITGAGSISLQHAGGRLPDGLVTWVGFVGALTYFELGEPLNYETLTFGASQNDFDITFVDVLNFLRLDPTAAALTITGFLAPNVNGSNARFDVANVNATNTVTLNNNSGSSTAGNRILVPGGGNLALAPNATCRLVYDFVSAAWRVVS